MAFLAEAKHLGKTYMLTHPNCAGELQVVIPLNILSFRPPLIENEDDLDDPPSIFGDLLKKFGREN